MYPLFYFFNRRLFHHLPRNTVPILHVGNQFDGNLAVSAPDGKAMLNRGMVIDTAEGPACVFRFAISDPDGKYDFLATDILTGSTQKHTINLEP